MNVPVVWQLPLFLTVCSKEFKWLFVLESFLRIWSLFCADASYFASGFALLMLDPDKWVTCTIKGESKVPFSCDSKLRPLEMTSAPLNFFRESGLDCLLGPCLVSIETCAQSSRCCVLTAWALSKRITCLVDTYSYIMQPCYKNVVYTILTSLHSTHK